MKKIITLFVLLASIITVWATPVSPDQAKKWAQNFLADNTQSRSQNVGLDLVWDGEDNISRTQNDPAFYIFNRTDQKGFVVVSGDDVVNPLIGYSFENNFTYDNLPDNIRLWFEDVKTEVAAIRRNTNIKTVHKAWQAITKADPVEIELPSALWDQDKPYNNKCPIDPRTNRRSVTGCTATALAIVMRGYKWPQMGKGSLPSYSYETSLGNNTIPERSVAHPYNWDNMPEKVDGTTTDEQKEEIANLMLDCGQMVKSVYGDGWTGGYTDFAPQYLEQNFSYSSDIKILKASNYPQQEWESIMKKELRENGQIVYGGFTSDLKGGHAFVLHGYTTNNYFLVNWGWGGRSNGRFKLFHLDPDDQGTGGSSDRAGYNYNQDAIVNMKRKIIEISALELFTQIGKDYQNNDCNDWGIKTNSETITKSVHVEQIAFANLNTHAFNGSIAYCLFDTNNKQKEVLSSPLNISMKGMTENREFYIYSINAQTLTIPASAKAGDYIALGEKGTGETSYFPLRGNLNSVSMLKIGDFDYAMKDDKVALAANIQAKETAYGIHCNEEDLTKGTEFTVTADQLMNISNGSIHCKISVGHYNRSHELKSQVSTNNITMSASGPGEAITDATFQCKITKDIMKGDYLSLCYSTDNGSSWKRVRALDNIKAHIDLKGTDFSLDKGTSVEYDNENGYIKVDNSLPDEYYMLKNEEGNVVQEALGNKPFIIQTNELKAARYTLWIYLTKDSKEKIKIDLKCGKL